MRKGGKRRVFFLCLVIVFFTSIQSFIFIDRNLKPTLMNVAQIRIKQIATQAINKAVTEKVAKRTNFDNLVDWKYDRNNKITGFMLNYAEHMTITSETEHVVQSTLDELQRMPEHVPLGQALDSAILASFSPDIPIKFVPAGAVQVELNTRQKDAGINMLLVEVFIRVTVEVAIIIPFETKSEIVKSEVPISYLLVVGDVPMYFFDGRGRPLDDRSAGQMLPPSIAIPPVMEEEGEPVENYRLGE